MVRPMILRYRLRCGHAVDVTDSTLPCRSERRRNLTRIARVEWWCRTCQGDQPIDRIER